ncbi:MAG: hypothetical protein HFH74_08520 [Lachnospiraceae bacterium]|nr:hypothetical protein [Lachnospiraceae bacterium]
MATPMHPFCPQERNLYLEYAKPIVIGNDCWIALDVTICGGGMIGDGCVIGAGSVVPSTPFFNSSYTKHSLFASLPRCRQSTMPPHCLLPPPCTDTNIKHFVYED